MNTSDQRETLGTRLGFILLSAGCAIGLGNVWRFPYIVGKYGGGAFVLVYLFFLLILGLPVMVMEFSIGRASKKNIGGALRALEPAGTKWHMFGVIAVAGNYILMMFYTVITGWILAYLAATAKGAFAGLDTVQIESYFLQLKAKPLYQFFWTAGGIIAAFLICAGGLRKGVEKISKLMMICLLTVMVILAVNSMLLDNSADSLAFYLLPDFSCMAVAGTGEAVFAAMSQAFFTLSVGMGGMTIFGSYIDRKQSLTGESIRIIALDTFVAVMSGLIIFPACFAFSVSPGAGPGLIFVTLPNIFNRMAAGRLWGSLFFTFMSFAALTTLIAVFENIVSYWMDMHGWSRKKACAVNCAAMIMLALPCILGSNLLSGFQPLGPGTSVLDLEDFLISSTIMPLGSLLFIVFCSHRCGWGWLNFISEADAGCGIKFPRGLKIYVQWILPVIVLIIFIKGYWDIFTKL